MNKSTGWDWAAEQLDGIRSQMRDLKQRESELVEILKGLGLGVHAGKSWAVVVGLQQRRNVDILALRNKYPDVAEEFETRIEYTTVKLTQIATKPVAVKGNQNANTARRKTTSKRTAKL